MKANLKVVSILLMAASVLVGCEETDDGIPNDVKSDYAYPQAKCDYSVRADSDVIDDIRDFDNNPNDPFYNFVQDVCNEDTIESDRISFNEFVDGGDEVNADINEGEDTVKAIVYNLRSDELPAFITGSSNYTRMKYVITDIDPEGIVMKSRITGEYEGVPFDIVFSNQSGWKNEGFFARKQVVSDGAEFSNINFDLSTNRNDFFEDAFITQANREADDEFIDFVLSYCDLDDAERYPFYHNSSQNLGGGIGSTPVTSTYGNFVFEFGSDAYIISNVEATVDNANNVTFGFDVVSSGSNTDGVVLTCFNPN